MSEARRSTWAVTVTSATLGMFLEPANEDNSGAFLARFVDVDGAPGEVARSECVRPGFRLERIDDASVSFTPFTSIVEQLIRGARPLRLTFRDPEVPDFRDAFGFPRDKVHADRAAALARDASEGARRNDRSWLDFLGELGGSRGASFGVQRLVRDAAGEIVFAEDPSSRVNAVSPVHGRIEGFGYDSPPPLSPRAVEGGEGEKSVECWGEENNRIGGGGEEEKRIGGGGRQKLPSSTAPTRLQVIGIHKRCWRPNGVGVPCPPGLATLLPGVLPPLKERARLTDRLTRLVLDGVPVAFRSAIWWEVSGARAKAAMHPASYYDRLAVAQPPADVAYAIGKDIDRTFPGHVFFESDKGQAALLRLLSAFALHNADIGYCQSLNFIAGFLLFLMGEERAFWVLDILVNEILPPDFYSQTLLGVHADQRVLARLVQEMMPQLAGAYEKAMIELQVITVGEFKKFKKFKKSIKSTAKRDHPGVRPRT